MRLCGVIFWLFVCADAGQQSLGSQSVDLAPTWPPWTPPGRQYHREPPSSHQSSSRSHVAELCSDPRCACTANNSVTNVSCHCSPQDQEATLAIHPSSVPRNVSALMIEGCRNVVFHDGGLKNLPSLVALTVIDVGEVAFQFGSFNQAHMELETTVTIGRCRQLVIKSGAFISHPLKPVALYSSQCHSVRVDESAFSRLYRLTLDDIQMLELSSYAFRFATTGSGARANIAIRRVTMAEIKSFTFPSPLDRLRLENVTVLGQIHPNATSALRVVELSIINSRIGSIAAGAFSHLTHLDSVELSGTTVDLIDSEAFASAASSLSIEDCNIGLMNHSALSMPAARVVLRANRIRVLATGAFNLREWNELLIENNTVVSVERHAFYNIGEPSKLPPIHIGHYPQHLDVRFVIRRNIFHRVEPGAFVISAQALKLQLEGNLFLQLCDCQMGAWAAELTQVSRRTTGETTTRPLPPSPLDGQMAEQWDEHNEPDEALWLGTSLFNSSSCWLDQAAAECSDDLFQSDFLPMNNYTRQFCSAPRQPQFAQCLAIKRSIRNSNQQSKDLSGLGGDGSIRSPVGLIRSDQDILLVIILAVLAAFVLLATFLGLVFARRRTKSRHQQNGILSSDKILPERDEEERITSSPLIPDGRDKQLGNGAVSSGTTVSGSITRLSVKEYRNYLEELGPIYSEPLDPPFNPSSATRSSRPQLPQLDPPELPAMPVQWTPNRDSSRKLANGNGEPIVTNNTRNTIDRGTQTLFETSTAGGDGEGQQSSLAQEFTEDVMSALMDKLDLSPTYSEVKDSINPKKSEEAPVSPTSITSPEFYDLIRVVDSSGKPKPSTSFAASEHIYCKPWSTDPLRSPLLSPDSAEPQFFPTSAQPGSETSKPAEKAQENGPYSVVDISLPAKASADSGTAPSPNKQQQTRGKKPEPFYIRGSLPKWPPPPSREMNNSRARPANSTPKFHSLNPTHQITTFSPASPTKDSKPSWRSIPSKQVLSKRSTPTRNNFEKKATSSPRSPNSNPDLVRKQETSKEDDPSLENLPSKVSQSVERASNHITDETASDYSEVTAPPFSFSFRKPLFSNRNPEDSSNNPLNPPSKPARTSSPTVCEYSDPRDRDDASEPLYSELAPLAEEGSPRHPS